MTGHTTAEHILDQIAALAPDQSEDTNKDTFRIGDLAREFDVTLRTLRFYEDRGLISPRRSGSTRIYTRQDRKRIRMIVLAKRLGFSLVDIQSLLDLYDSGQENDNHMQLIREKFAEQESILRQKKDDLENSLAYVSRAVQSLEDME